MKSLPHITSKGMTVSTPTANGWTKEKIQHLIDTRDKAVVRALIQIYNRQTASEQNTLATTEHNGVGFCAHDARFLSDVARKATRYHLTEKQIAAVRVRIRRYWRQLLEIAATSQVRAPD
jgi:hypothetical protein